MPTKGERVEPRLNNEGDWLRNGAADYVRRIGVKYPVVRPDNDVLAQFVLGNQEIISFDLFTEGDPVRQALARKTIIEALEREDKLNEEERTGRLYGAMRGEATFSKAIYLLIQALRGRNMLEELNGTRSEYTGDDEGKLTGNIGVLLFNRLYMKTRPMPVYDVSLPEPFVDVVVMADDNNHKGKSQKIANKLILERCVQLYKEKGIAYAMVFAGYCEVDPTVLARYFKDHQNELKDMEKSNGKIPLPGRKDTLEVMEKVRDILVPDAHPRMSTRVIEEALGHLVGVGMGDKPEMHQAGIHRKRADLMARGIAVIASLPEVAARTIEVDEQLLKRRAFWKLVDFELEQQKVKGLYTTEIVTSRLEYDLPWMRFY